MANMANGTKNRPEAKKQTDTDRLTRQIEIEQAKLEKYKAQIALLQEKTAASEINLERLKTTQITNEYSAAENLLSANGSTFKEFMEALKEGDLLTLQEKIEKHKSGAANGNKAENTASAGKAENTAGGNKSENLAQADEKKQNDSETKPSDNAAQSEADLETELPS